jgi:hypothetical protein
MKKSHSLSLVAACIAAAAVSPALAADWTDASVGYRYYSHQSEPGVSDKTPKNALNFTYVSGDRLGTNLFVGDVIMSGKEDPANGGTGGAQEFYGFYKRSFSMNAMTGNKGGYGFAKDIYLTGRVDLSAKNTTFAPRVRKVRLGAEAAMPVSAGFWNLGAQIYNETNHNGIMGVDVNFKTTSVITSAWSIPVKGIGSFEGYADITAPKGKDGFGADTKMETLIGANLMFDVGGPKSGVKAGFGVQYWKNKFGSDGSAPGAKGTKATSPVFLLDYHM